MLPAKDAATTQPENRFTSLGGGRPTAVVECFFVRDGVHDTRHPFLWQRLQASKVSDCAV
jgi:hypothetical protein